MDPDNTQVTAGHLSRTILRRFLLWLIICSVSAAPSFITARGHHADSLGMVLGVLAFVVLYTSLTSTQRFERIYAKRYIRGTMRFGYGFRLLLSLLGGIAAIAELDSILALPLLPDLLCGIVSTGLAGAFWAV